MIQFLWIYFDPKCDSSFSFWFWIFFLFDALFYRVRDRMTQEANRIMWIQEFPTNPAKFLSFVELMYFIRRTKHNDERTGRSEASIRRIRHSMLFNGHQFDEQKNKMTVSWRGLIFACRSFGINKLIITLRNNVNDNIFLFCICAVNVI